MSGLAVGLHGVQVDSDVPRGAPLSRIEWTPSTASSHLIATREINPRTGLAGTNGFPKPRFLGRVRWTFVSSVPETGGVGQPLEAYFVEAGHRAHVIWALDGSFRGSRDASMDIVNPPGGGSEGIWVEPWRVADGIHLALRRGRDAFVRVEQFATGYQRTDGVSEIACRIPALPWLRISKRVWVPLDQPAVVVDLHLDNPGEEPQVVELRGQTRLRLSVGWPVGAVDAPTVSLTDGRLRATNAWAEASLLVDPPADTWLLDASPIAGWTQEVTVPPGASARVRVVLAAAALGEGATEAAEHVLREADWRPDAGGAGQPAFPLPGSK